MPEPLRISLEEAKQRAEQGDVTYLDVIDSHAYDDYDLQIQGAVRIEPKNIGDRYQELPKEDTILTY